MRRRRALLPLLPLLPLLRWWTCNRRARHRPADSRQPDLAEECRRQSLLVANDPQEKDVLQWIEQVADTRGWV